MEEEPIYYFDIEFTQDGESINKVEVWSCKDLKESTSVFIEDVCYIREDRVMDMLFNK